MAPRSNHGSAAAAELPDEAVLAAPQRPKLVYSKAGRTFSSVEVMAHIGRYAKANNARALLEVAATLGVWFYLFRCSWWWWPIHSLMTIRLFVVCVHDPAHGALLSSRKLNTALAVLCGPLTFMPGLWWQYGHDYHHEHSNDLDFDQASQTAPNTVLEFLSWPSTYKALYRYFTRPLVFLSQTSWISMTFLQAIKATTFIEWALQLAYIAIAWWTGHLPRFVAIMVLASPLGVFMFHLQHTFEGCVREHGKDYFWNGYEGSSLLLAPWWLRPFSASIEVHHIHHLNAKVPFYRLYECLREAPEGMWDGVRTITLSEGYDSLKFALWDHVQKRLVSMEEVEAAVAKHGVEGVLAQQKAAMEAQVQAREKATAVREKEEAAARAQRVKAAQEQAALRKRAH